MKVCTSCKTELLEDKFHKDKTRYDGLNPRCKHCKSQQDALYRNNNKEHIKLQQKEYYKNNSNAIKERASDWYQSNTTRHKDRMQKYFQENKTTIKEKQRVWNENNKVKMQEYMNNYHKQKYKNDLDYKIKSVLSARLRSCVRSKKAATVEYLGCNIEFFKEWIEYQFTHEMTWDNYGSYWHFDHVKPCSSYDLTNNSEVEKCFHWKNIRPLEAQENLSKYNLVDEIIIKNHMNIVDEFITRRTKV